MKAFEFIQNVGWSKATEVINNRPLMNSARYRPTDNKYSSTLSSGHTVCTIELKRFIESWKLLWDFFNTNSVGIEKALMNANKEMNDLESKGITEFYERYADDYSCTVNRMKQAVIDVAKVENFKL
ncbi:hypothetical protein [Acinetobacter bereziniae]|uniref:hypothetical protein n=1 Tax=Acinetobacter bereziniae TaxID=106648 RepID=UPI000C2B548C|nr:hypothetical protein [Acinetobacter bereziniae]ATZ64273.1 hypothetical protein BSR55_13295 [Acinetobacter bereziniae]